MIFKMKSGIGGYGISFAGQKATSEQVFGKRKISPSSMTKKRFWSSSFPLIINLKYYI